MEYEFKTLTIKSLIDIIKRHNINLRPSYQRNFIWGPKDQRCLIDTMKKGWPLPNFFIYKDEKGQLEMVDGQQRATTIYKYANNEFADGEKLKFKNIESDNFLNYKICVIEITNLETNESLEEFYTLVNKRGLHLNPAEVNKAEYHGTLFMSLVKDLMEDQQLIDLDLFSDSVSKRMNDRSLIEELAAVLFAGITDKRLEVEKLFQAPDLHQSDIEDKKVRFKQILNRLAELNTIRPINKTRYKQRNDFYTLFCFINEHLDDDISILKEQYKLLVFISDRNDIRPTNEECETFQNYAVNCVTQSNSKNARIRRLEIFDHILCNDSSNPDLNEDLSYINKFYKKIFSKKIIPYKQIGTYFIINIDLIK